MPDTPHDACDKEIELMKLKLEYQAKEQDAQRVYRKEVITLRLQALGTVLTLVAGIIGPILLARYHVQSDKKIDAIQSDTKAAAVVAAVGVLKTEEVQQDLQTVSQERKDQFNQISAKQDADLASWRAYHSNDKDDMAKANESLAKAEQMPPVVELKPPPAPP